MAEVKSIDIRCLTCGVWFQSPIFFGGYESFDGAQMSGNIVTCPNGHFTSCNKENMRVRFQGGGFVGNDTTHKS
jgi:hypothetical protein